MNAEESPKHSYARGEVDPEAGDSLGKIARRIAPGSTVLDLGCAVGALGRYLTTAASCIVDGIEANPEAAALARPFYRDVMELDLESTDEFRRALADRRYDVIVCADVLEHLRDPGSLLDALKPLLLPDGELLISIPNVGHIGVIVELLDGEFCYREEGILDETHLRFFTRASLLRMLSEHAMAAQIVDLTVNDLEHSEFRFAHRSGLAQFLISNASAPHDLLTYQFIASARVRNGSDPQSVQATDQPNTETLFQPFNLANQTQIYYRTIDGEYRDENSAIARAPRWSGPQLLRCEIPRSPLEQVLRIDFTDHPGVVALHSLRFVRGEHEIYRWDPATPLPIIESSRHQVVILTEPPTSPTTLMITEIPAWVELAVQVPGSPTETTVELSLATIAPAESLAFINTYLQEIDQRTQTEIAATTFRLNADRVTREHILLSRIRYLERERRRLIDEYAVRLRQSTEQIERLELRITELLTSTSWRLTAPVRATTKRLVPGLKKTLRGTPTPSHDQQQPSVNEDE